jgi:hypothetical protein
MEQLSRNLARPRNFCHGADRSALQNLHAAGWVGSACRASIEPLDAQFAHALRPTTPRQAHRGASHRGAVLPRSNTLGPHSWRVWKVQVAPA